eukprot:TRINITY_DN7801_c0_g1_i1.p1 TRINITY_DN7801_c0_g1~~TRINITY_DN7801_c0_g1_i1.p1  ORF type:complete len:484 (-),score=93.27 TRINITY_DN7801_c0_g1_i1:14-1465(-)
MKNQSQCRTMIGLRMQRCLHSHRSHALSSFRHSMSLATKMIVPAVGVSLAWVLRSKILGEEDEESIAMSYDDWFEDRRERYEKRSEWLNGLIMGDSVWGPPPPMIQSRMWNMVSFLFGKEEAFEETKIGPVVQLHRSAAIAKGKAEQGASVLHSITPQGHHGAVFGMYDAHLGRRTRNYLAENMTPLARYYIERLDTDQEEPQWREKTAEAMADALIRLDYRLLIRQRQSTAVPYQIMDLSGATALVAYFTKDTIFVANTGNVRAFLGKHTGENNWKAVELSEEHTVMNPSERERIFREHPDESDVDLVSRNRLKGYATFTRSIGDAWWKFKHVNQNVGQPYEGYFNPPYVSSTPHASYHPIEHGDAFVIIAPQSFWDQITPDEAVGRLGQLMQHGDRENNLNYGTFLLAHFFLKQYPNVDGPDELRRLKEDAKGFEETTIYVFNLKTNPFIHFRGNSKYDSEQIVQIHPPEVPFQVETDPIY